VNKEDIELVRVPLTSIMQISTGVDARESAMGAVQVFRDALAVKREGAFRCELVGLDGRMMESVSGNGRVEFGSLRPPGMYLLRVSRGGGIETTLVVKAR